ncbi:MAG: endo alpha-1,4 polygalactosaminidase [Balneolaceae bacterium]|nr:endo alpha-1,4 polygalactosaminidase [Balneolaceae bacterium]
MKSHAVTLLLLFLLSGCKATEEGIMDLSQNTPFGAIYAKTTPSQVQNYNMVIIEPDHYTKAEIDALKATNTRVIGYITLGEVDKSRWYFPLLEERGFVGINENWDSPYLDLADDSTRAIVLDKVLPEIMIKGLDGVFLDTVDAVSPYGERSHLQSYMVQLIQGIRNRYPNTTIIQNAGFFLLEQTAPLVDGVLIEDIATSYDFGKREYIYRDQEDYQQRLDYLKKYTLEYDLPFFIIDFAVSPEKQAQVRQRLDSLKLPYFISNIGLTKLPSNTNRVANKISN